MQKRFKLTGYEVKELIFANFKVMIEDDWTPEAMVEQCEEFVKKLEDSGLVLTEEEEETLGREYREESELPI